MKTSFVLLISTISLCLIACGGGGSINAVGGGDNFTYTFSSIYTFAGSPDGFAPTGGLVQDAAGNLYGTTTFGGDLNHGTVFKVDASGKETLLYSFTGGADGTTPSSDLVRDSSGSLYGTAAGGTYNAGTVFKIDPSGAFSVLYSFTGDADGKNPSPLLLDSAGNLYGTAFTGGQVNCTPFGQLTGCGVIFKIDQTGTENVLYSFTGGNDGGNPSNGPIRDSAGNLYGTAGGGTVFKLSTAGNLSVLYKFKGGKDGAGPAGRLLQDATGNLYGTTDGGGANDNGTVFKLAPKGSKTILHSFAGSPDGAEPEAGLVMDSAGNLFGTTVIAGTSLVGVVFRVDPAGNEIVLHNFGGPDGSNPSGLMIDQSGNLYGTTVSGGAAPGYGNVFKLTRIQ